MTRRIWALILLLLAPLQLPAMDQQMSLDQLRQRYEDGACKHNRDHMVEALRSYRRELWREGRRSLQADYMLASCLCPAPGADALAKLPTRYRGLSSDESEAIQHAARDCQGGTLARYLPPGSGVAFVGGKGSESEEVVKFDHSQMSPEAVRRFDQRLFPKGQRDAAVKGLRARGFRQLYAGENFIVVGQYEQTELREIEQLMEQVLKALAKQFAFQAPRTLITVYLLPSRDVLKRHAREVHDLSISSGTWAYTFPLDASISVWRDGGRGTVGHEVMHALLEQNLPYAPAWLNEGSAALFEEFRLLDGPRIEGTFRRDHWRIPYLKPEQIPPLSELVAMSWGELDNPYQFQVNHATAKLLALYLQERGQLDDLLGAYQGRDLFELGDDAGVLARASGITLGELDRRFRDWLAGKLGWSEAQRSARPSHGGRDDPSVMQQTRSGAVQQIRQTASERVSQPRLSDREVLDQLSLTNSARFVGQRSGRDWYEWTAYIDGPEAAQGRIQSVRYHLHASFSPAERLGDPKRPGHPISTSGWGVFTLRAVVTLQGGEHREYAHKLRFR